MRRSSFSTTLPGTTLVLLPPSMRPDVEIRVGDARAPAERRARSTSLCAYSAVSSVGRLQRIDAGVRIGGVRPAVQRDLELQAAVVRGDDLVAEAGGDQQVGLRQLLREQPAGAELAAELLVVGEVQLDAAASALRAAAASSARSAKV